MRLEINPVSLPEEAEKFFEVHSKIYATDPHWVAPLIAERKRFLDPAQNPFFQHAEVACFIALRDQEPVGTIAAIIDETQQESEPGLGLFGFFEFVDDRTIALALFQRALDWLQARGMEEVRGPCNFTLNHEAGLLVEGFDTDPVALTTYNPAYYPQRYQELGLLPVQDLYGWWLEGDSPPPRLQRVAERVRERHPQLSLRPVNLDEFSAEIQRARELFNGSWAENWGHTTVEADEFAALAEGLKPMLHPKLSWFVEDEQGPVAMAICLLDYNQVVKPMHGRIWPLGWFHWLTRRSRVDQMRVFLLGVRPSHQHIALGALLYERIWAEAVELGLRGAEASWVLESNHRMNSALKKLGARRYKTWRLYNAMLRPPTQF